MSTLDQTMNFLADHEWEDAFNITNNQMSLYRCTGTIYGGLYCKIRRDRRAVFFTGRIYIQNFVRKSNNPGVYIPNLGLPSGYANTIGIRGESSTELAQYNPGSNIISTTETFTNASNGRLTLVCPGAIMFCG